MKSICRFCGTSISIELIAHFFSEWRNIAAWNQKRRQIEKIKKHFVSIAEIEKIVEIS